MNYNTLLAIVTFACIPFNTQVIQMIIQKEIF